MFQRFRKKNQSTEEVTMTAETYNKNKKSSNEMPGSQVFHKHPKILLIDIKDNSEKVLKSAGFNVETGTFGTPYKVTRSAEYLPISVNAKLPNYQEQELIIIDLFANKTLETTPTTNEILEGEKGFFGKCNHGIIDPRPFAVLQVHSDFNKILSHNGVFIVFADSDTYSEIVFGQVRYNLEIEERGFNIWDFVDTLEGSRFNTYPKYGTEISIERPDTLLGRFLEKYIDSTKYTCTIEPVKHTDYRTKAVIGYSNRSAESWVVTAVNKYNEPVAGVFTPDENKNGWIFIFPQINDKANFLLEFLRDVLPVIIPELFPYSENKNWVERSEYQSTYILELNKQIEEIENEAKQKVEKINEEIQKEKQQIEYQNKLLTEDGEPLVKAVETTLKVLGFTKVINVDEEYAKQGKTDSNDEDLQIRDEPTSILVEIKGVVGTPRDNDVFQITKHVPIRMNEWKEFGVKALSIINHQKAIPALERNNETVFRDLILKSAVEQKLGLMTTFDLYRLVRSYLKNGWKHENIKDIFLQSGQISIIPSHYQYVGKIEHFYEKAGVVSVRIEENLINLSDTIAFELPIEFEEMKIDSLQVEKNSVQIAEVSMLAGIKTNLPKQDMKNGIRVFRIITSES
jgi:hypothetical protein